MWTRSGKKGNKSQRLVSDFAMKYAYFRFEDLYSLSSQINLNMWPTLAKKGTSRSDQCLILEWNMPTSDLKIYTTLHVNLNMWPTLAKQGTSRSDWCLIMEWNMPTLDLKIYTTCQINLNIWTRSGETWNKSQRLVSDFGINICQPCNLPGLWNGRQVLIDIHIQLYHMYKIGLSI